MSMLILIVVITILASASCSLMEAVLYSTRTSTLESSKAQSHKSKSALLLLGMKKNISEPIAAILILNTIANTGGAAIAGMYAVEELGAVWLPAFSAVFTAAILFLSEIYPKTVGAIHWRIIWPFIVYPLKVLQFVLYPFIYITQKATSSVIAKEKAKSITEDEILALIKLGAREGEISRVESDMVRNIINLEELKVKQIMTPRRMIFTLAIKMRIRDAFEAAKGKGVSRIPVFRDESENIVGYVTAQELTEKNFMGNNDDNLESIIRPIAHVPESSNCLSLLTSFLKNRWQIAIVIDEYGGVDGLVALEDLIETVLGMEIVDETDKFIDLQEEAKKAMSKSRQKGTK